MFDKDDDGRITTEELSDVLASIGFNIGKREVEKMVKETSSDGKTEYVTLPDFVKAMESFSRNQKRNKELIDTFKVFDVDGDGFITFSELKQVMTNQFGARDITDASVQAMIEKADIDGDGRVNYAGRYELYIF